MKHTLLLLILCGCTVDRTSEVEELERGIFEYKMRLSQCHQELAQTEQNLLNCNAKGKDTR